MSDPYYAFGFLKSLNDLHVLPFLSSLLHKMGPKYRRECHEGHEVQDSWPYLSNATPWPYELSHVKNKFSLVGLTRRKGYDIIGVNIFLRKIMRFPHKKCQTGAPYTTLVRSTSAKTGSSTA